MRISVAMCTYNGARYLRDQLDSIQAQSRPPDELVVCDDCSSDTTRQVVREFAEQAQFPINLVVNQQILGSTKNFEKAIELCSGDVIALSDQDDVWRPEKLQTVERWFADDERTGMVFSDAEIVDEKLNPIASSLWKESGLDNKKQRLINDGKAFEVLLPAWWVTGATMAFRAEYKTLVLPIPTDLPMIHDGWIALMIAAVARVKLIAAPLTLYRQHDRQQLGAPTGHTDTNESSVTALMARLKLPHRSYGEQVRTLEAVHKRLIKTATAQDRVSVIEDQLKHLNARSNLPGRALRRGLLVLRELLAMRYHKYSNGIFSAARDFLYQPTHRDRSHRAS